MGKAEEPVQRITNAPAPLEADQRHRMIVYSVQMGIRLVCLFLAVLTPSPWRWLFVLGAVLLPYTAVLLANAGRDRREADVILLDPRQIPSRPAGREGNTDNPEQEGESEAPTTRQED